MNRERFLLVASSVAYVFVGVSSDMLYGDDVDAGLSEFRATTVPGTETKVQDGWVRAVDGGMNIKCGAGTWEIQESQLGKATPNAFGVREGTLKFVQGGTVPDIPVPEVLGSAAMHLSALVGERQMQTRVVGDVTYVDTWWDVRDVNRSATNHWFASAYGIPQDNVPTPTSPTLVEKDSRSSVWFGEHVSGQSMDWRLPSGNFSAVNNIYHIFVVHGVYQSYGFLLGAGNATRTGSTILTLETYFPIGTYGKTTSLGVYAEAGARVHDSRTYLNGTFIDPSATVPVTGFQLYEVNMSALPVGVNNFFNDRDMKNRTGGGYIAEAIVFTNQIAESERLAVESYLMKKWSLTGNSSCGELRIAEGAYAEWSGTDDGELTRELSGNGTFVKSGVGSLLFPNKKDWRPHLTGLDVQGGRAILRRALPLKMTAGKVYDVYPTNEGVVVESDSLGVGNVVVKKGCSTAYVRELDSDVNELDVESGSVVLTPCSAKDTLDAGSVGEVVINNCSFESHPATVEDGCIYWAGPKTANYNGWTLTISSAGHGIWTKGICGYNRFPRDHFPQAQAPQGDWFYAMKHACTLSQVVTVPEAGYYDISFWTVGRTEYPGQRMRVALVDETIPSAPVTNVFGDVSSLRKQSGFVKQTVRGRVAEAGQYRLLFATYDHDDNIGLDDIHMVRVPLSVEDVWPVPGGTFEDVVLSSWADFKDSNLVPGWTFNRPASAGNNTAVGVVSAIYRTTKGQYWNASKSQWRDDGNGENVFTDYRLPVSGGFQLAFDRHEASTETTFTPPAGEWRLRAKAAERGIWAGGKLAASITKGGRTDDLGTLSNIGHLMQERLWPMTFTADGNTAVTLTLKFSGDANTYLAGFSPRFLIDDVVLVPADVELVKNGGFESAVPNTSVGNRWNYTYTDWAIGNPRTVDHKVNSNESGYMKYEYYTDSYGFDVYEGANYLLLTDDDEARQKVAFPRAGRYRLVFNLHERLNVLTDPKHREQAPLIVSVVKGDATDFSTAAYPPETNFNARVHSGTGYYVQHVLDFDVAEAGNYTLILAGINEGWMCQAIVDCVSIREAPALQMTKMLPESLVVKVADGASMHLGFSGTNRIGRLMLGGHYRSGFISSKTHPDFISGPGCLYVERRGGCVIIR